MPYIHFTEEQKSRASEVDLVEFLRHKVLAGDTDDLRRIAALPFYCQAGLE